MKEEKPKRGNTRASSDFGHLWVNLNWSVIEEKVSKLQSRIAKAVVRGRFNLAKKLQYLLSNSFYAKLLAVKRVTQNKGKNTSGVDGILWNSPSQKYKGALSLSSKGYKASPLKRIYIKKSNGKKRPLGIPTIYDRAMQALYLLTLDPVAETILDEKSFGFRKHRSTKDACANLFNLLAKKTSAKWILEGDIKACFDEISHQWLLNNIMTNKRVLKQFLKSGFVYSNKLFPTKQGSPQGGIISPVLANLALNGMGDLLREKYWRSKRGIVNHRYNRNKVNIVVYADDFVITANDKETLIEIKKLLEQFLMQRGLKLSKEKTVITHIHEGFDFLGWNFRKYKTKLIIKPSKKTIKRVKASFTELIKKSTHFKQEDLIKRLNQIISGWCNYHKHICAKETFRAIDAHIFKCLWLWAKRRHPQKSATWRRKKYFHSEGFRSWIFKSDSNKLHYARDFQIKRHVMIQLVANPYLEEYYEYFQKRRFANS